jgi:hypothetical protein
VNTVGVVDHYLAIKRDIAGLTGSACNQQGQSLSHAMGHWRILRAGVSSSSKLRGLSGLKWDLLLDEVG